MFMIYEIGISTECTLVRSVISSSREMVAALTERGWDLALPEVNARDIHSRKTKILWLIKHGTPWFMKRSVDLLPAALILMAWELCKVIRESVTSRYSLLYATRR
jgi:hypothetical protein